MEKLFIFHVQAIGFCFSNVISKKTSKKLSKIVGETPVWLSLCLVKLQAYNLQLYFKKSDSCTSVFLCVKQNFLEQFS